VFKKKQHIVVRLFNNKQHTSSDNIINFIDIMYKNKSNNIITNKSGTKTRTLYEIYSLLVMKWSTAFSFLGRKIKFILSLI